MQAKGYLSDEVIAPLEAPFEMPMVMRPSFPDAVFPLIHYEVKLGDESFNNADGINKAISDYSSAGGGTVLVNKGTYHAGPITLKSNVNLHVLGTQANPPVKNKRLGKSFWAKNVKIAAKFSA